MSQVAINPGLPLVRPLAAESSLPTASPAKNDSGSSPCATPAPPRSAPARRLL